MASRNLRSISLIISENNVKHNHGYGRTWNRTRILPKIEYIWSSAGMKGTGKLEIPEKTRRPSASSGTIPTYDNPRVAQSRIKRGSYRWEASICWGRHSHKAPGTRQCNDMSRVFCRRRRITPRRRPKITVCPAIANRRLNSTYGCIEWMRFSYDGVNLHRLNTHLVSCIRYFSGHSLSSLDMSQVLHEGFRFCIRHVPGAT
ncbi:hypothetical protein PR048_010598 [Dryococelus australis]|uniref:Ribosomal protein L2 n=1 Tax=Dryococelus australis TaxID=614101 RepID=A0ABQ9I378_9NEOP|nr:hypothetical protein PR048_010598 [Dryococelus australis]